MKTPEIAVIVATLSAIISAGSLITAIVALKIGAPKVRISPRLFRAGDDSWLEVEIVNSGRGAVTVSPTILTVWIHQTHGIGLPYKRKFMAHKPFQLKWEGPDLPFRLESNSGMSWTSWLEKVEWYISHDFTAKDIVYLFVKTGKKTRRVRVVYCGYPMLGVTTTSLKNLQSGPPRDAGESTEEGS